MSATASAAITASITARARQSAAATPTALASAVSGENAAGTSAGGATSMAPVASADTVSPSTGGGAGRVLRASPPGAVLAMCRQAAGLSTASVATTAMVVFSELSGDSSSASAAICSSGGV